MSTRHADVPSERGDGPGEAPPVAVEHGHDVQKDGVLRDGPRHHVAQRVQVRAAVVRHHALATQQTKTNTQASGEREAMSSGHHWSCATAVITPPFSPFALPPSPLPPSHLGVSRGARGVVECDGVELVLGAHQLEALVALGHKLLVLELTHQAKAGD